MTDSTELLTQLQGELAHAKGRIAALEAQLAQATSSPSREERIFRYITECCWDAFVLVDSRGALQYVSPAVTRMTGYSVDEYIQMGMNELTHPDDRGYAQMLLTELLHTPGEHHTFEIRVRHKDGRWLWLEPYFCANRRSFYRLTQIDDISNGTNREKRANFDSIGRKHLS